MVAVMAEATTTKVMGSMVSLLPIKDDINMKRVHAYDHDRLNWSRVANATYKLNYPSGEAAVPQGYNLSSRSTYFPFGPTSPIHYR